MQSGTVWYATALRGTARHSAVWDGMVKYSVVQQTTVPYNALQCITQSARVRSWLASTHGPMNENCRVRLDPLQAVIVALAEKAGVCMEDSTLSLSGLPN